MPKPLNYFDIEIHGGTVVTRVHSDLGNVPFRLLSVEINALRSYLNELGTKQLLIEIQPTSGLNAEQIRGLVFFAREFRQRGAVCAFSSGGPEVQRALSKFGLSKPTDWYPTTPEGVIALGGGIGFPTMPPAGPISVAPVMSVPPVLAVPLVQAFPNPAATPVPPIMPASAGRSIRPGAGRISSPEGRVLPAHELTLRANRRQPILESDLVCAHLAERIRAESDQFEFSVWAFVFMPDHFHLLVRSKRLNYDIGDYLAAIKQSFQERAVDLLSEHAPQVLGRLRSQQGGRTVYELWQLTTGQNRSVDFSRPLRPLVNHMHENPVRKGLVMDPLEWKWSSAGSYAGRPLKELQHDPAPPELLDN
jgi:putative transposase